VPEKDLDRFMLVLYGLAASNYFGFKAYRKSRGINKVTRNSGGVRITCKLWRLRSLKSFPKCSGGAAQTESTCGSSAAGHPLP
jgi:hypothetical protein